MQDSVAALIAKLKEDHPDAPFLALGQTVFWDEPMKAVWRSLLDQSVHSKAKLIAGIHDTDYFAKTTALFHSDQPFVMLAHDDLATRGLWSAAGELSAMFGSEDVPTRAACERYGVPFDSLAAEFPGDYSEFIAAKTAAWGWRGLVGTSPQQRIAHDVALEEILPALREQLAWGFELSMAQVAPERRAAGQALCSSIRRWMDDIVVEGSCRGLSELYEALLPRFYELLLDRAPVDFETSTSLRLFRFNSQTCRLPRFQFVDLFLNHASGPACRTAYNRAVAGGGMYGLDSFGERAQPFDIVAAGIGRGTLHVTPRRVVVDLPGAHRLVVEASVRSVGDLAAVLEEQLGDEIALVGKAVSLISMIASEFVVVFHETASGYTDRTAAMNDAIRAAGIPLDLKPIVRLQYPTWDALAVLGDESGFELPPHLAQAFGKTRISAGEFAARWREVVDEQQDKLGVLRGLRSQRALMRFLDQSGDQSQCWSCHLDIYDKAMGRIARRSAKLSRLKAYIAELRAERYRLKQTADQLQRRKGDHFRLTIQPLCAELGEAVSPERIAVLEQRLARVESERRKRFSDKIDETLALIAQQGRVLKALRSELRRAERSAAIQRERLAARQSTLDAEYARLELVRAALITTSSLPHTQSRPTAWWLPLVDPTGRWFAAIAEGATARLERV